LLCPLVGSADDLRKKQCRRSRPPDGTDAPVVARLSFLDRWLALGRRVPGTSHVLNSAHVTAGVPAPIFAGLLIMMYPVLAKVRCGQLNHVTSDRRLLLASLMLN
jgi:hypothetical protein